MADGCTASGCERSGTNAGLCGMHYQRQYHHGDVNIVKRVYRLPTYECAIDDCDARAISKGLCRTHYARKRRHGDATRVKHHGKSILEPFGLYRRFTNKVLLSSSGCWIWGGSLDKDGYGYITITNEDGTRSTLKIHRLAFTLFVGVIPVGLNVLHSCDVRNCCAPEHLFLGSQQDNMRDMFAKGRAPPQQRSKCHGS